jgi:hypothetical protein
MFGCMDTHVHRKIVMTQLRMMSTSDLHPLGSSQEGLGLDVGQERQEVVNCRPTGDARVAARMARMMIMVVWR